MGEVSARRFQDGCPKRAHAGNAREGHIELEG